MMSGMKEFIVFCIALCLAAGSHAATVVDDRALSDEADSKNWLAYGKTYSEKRFSHSKLVLGGRSYVGTFR